MPKIPTQLKFPHDLQIPDPPLTALVLKVTKQTANSLSENYLTYEINSKITSNISCLPSQDRY